MTRLSSKPTMKVREALDELLQQNDGTSGKEVADMYLGPDIFVAMLRQRRVLEGEWEQTERTVDLFDLMDQHQQNDQPRPRTTEPLRPSAGSAHHSS